MKLIFYFIVGYTLYSIYRVVKQFIIIGRLKKKIHYNQQTANYEKDISDEAIIIEDKKENSK